MSAAAPLLDQIAGVAKVLGNSFQFALPEPRPIDSVTLVHIRSAERVHEAARWLFRGSEMRSVMMHTPFWAENTDDLWNYYESLSLQPTFHQAFCLLIARELAQAKGILTREQFPKLGWAINIYAAVVGLANLMPRRFFYQLHRMIWTFERYQNSAREPDMPLLLSNDTRAAIKTAVDAGWKMVGGSATMVSKTYGGEHGTPAIGHRAFFVSATAGMVVAAWWWWRHHGETATQRRWWMRAREILAGLPLR